MKEVWKVIPNFKDYEISNYGNIRSKERVKTYKNKVTRKYKSIPKKLRIHPENQFLMTDLMDNYGKRKTIYPHKIVAEVFLKNPDPTNKKVVIHLDHDTKNNFVGNLKWASHKESIQRGFETGRRDNSDLWEKRRAKYGPKGGVKSPGRPDPIKERDIKKIIKLRAEGTKLNILAKQFNCSVSHIYNTIQKNLDSI